MARAASKSRCCLKLRISRFARTESGGQCCLRLLFSQAFSVWLQALQVGTYTLVDPVCDGLHGAAYLLSDLGSCHPRGF